MATGPSVQRVKKEKRDRGVEPSDGMSRRRFLTFLGTGSAALAAGSSGVLVGCAEGEEGGPQGGSQEGSGSSGSAGSSGGQNAAASFGPIQPSDEDDIKLPEGFRYEIVRSSGDSMGGGMVYGDHNDFVAYFPVDALDGGDDPEDGILFVNHEYINPMFWSDYADTEGATEKTSASTSSSRRAPLTGPTAGRTWTCSRTVCSTSRTSGRAAGSPSISRTTPSSGTTATGTRRISWSEP